MTSFRLEPTEKAINIDNFRMIYKKNEYGPKVKLANWEDHLGSLPFDNDCLKSNYKLSHYNRLGTQPDEPWGTTTQAMLEQIHFADRRKYNVATKKCMVNFLGYSDYITCDSEYEKPSCIGDFINDYSTTMQESYTSPYPYCMKRLSAPTLPFLTYRKINSNNPNLSDYKFYDENEKARTNLIQKFKMDRQISINPITCLGRPGEIYLSKPESCVQLGYFGDRDLPTKCYD